MDQGVTVGIPVRNGVGTLAGALDSLIAQTHTDWTAIISDNASTDGTLALARSYAAREPRIRVESLSQDIGAVGNFNHLLDVADRPFFAWLADDDVWDPRFLSLTVAALEANPAAVGCAVAIDAHFRSDPNRTYPPAHDLASSDLRRRCRAALSMHGSFSVYGLYRRGLIPAEVRLPRVQSADSAFTFRLALRGPFTYVDEVLYRWQGGDAREKVERSSLDRHIYASDSLTTIFDVAREAARGPHSARARLSAAAAIMDQVRQHKTAYLIGNRSALQSARRNHQWGTVAARAFVHIALRPAALLDRDTWSPRP